MNQNKAFSNLIIDYAKPTQAKRKPIKSIWQWIAEISILAAILAITLLITT